MKLAPVVLSLFACWSPAQPGKGGVGTPVRPGTLTPEAVSQGWIQVFDGESLFGWTAEGGSLWRVQDVALTADSGPAGWLRSDSPFADFRLKLEFRIEKAGTPVSVFLRAAAAGNPAETGYEIVASGGKGPAPAPGKWHALDILAQGSTFVARLDGKLIRSFKDFRRKAGSIGLRYAAAGKVEYRAVALRPIDMACLFNGKDLTGWRKVERVPAPPQPAEWSVREGAIHVEKGPGMLETEQAWDDFILQADVKTNSTDPKRHPNSGIFFRGDRGIFWSGYEAQIRNEFSDGDPSKPVDFGTGGIYRNQPARRVAARDNEWFTMTILASGRHLAVWVNGIPVTNWEDPNREGLDVRAKHARLKRGTLSLQAHDPTTNLDFKNICIGR